MQRSSSNRQSFVPLIGFASFELSSEKDIMKVDRGWQGNIKFWRVGRVRLSVS